MLIVSGWVKMDAADKAKLLPAANEMIEASLREEGCAEYAYSFDIDDPNMMRINEYWVDQAALDSHFASEHMAKFQAVLAGIEIQSADVRVYSANEIRPLIQA